MPLDLMTPPPLEPPEFDGASPPSAARRHARPPWLAPGGQRGTLVMLVGSVIGLLGHVGFLVLFVAYGLAFMAAVNVGSVLLWLAAGRVALRGHHGAAIAIACVELVVHACLAVWQVGLGAGFQYYLWSAACLLVLNPHMRSDIALVAGVCVSLVFASLHLIFPIGAIAAPLREVQGILNYVNALCAPLPIVFVVIMVRQVSRHQETALREVAARDEVTGVFNRRHGMRVLNRALETAGRDGDTLFVMLGDVDHFKSINDTFGHHVGDGVLAQVAATLACGLRSDDMLCRWGGEEFLMVFSGFPHHGIRERMDTLRRTLVHTSFGEGLPGVTMSFGLTRARPGDSADEIVRRADALMYEAKRAGRNRIVDDLHPRAVAMPTIVAAESGETP
ncbi:GGDEF domain-containing protein [Nitrogeniibacter mangrovi]|uniref:diguanylate cyclase n=1 Tax=Nitrogeniibacter mangrovi TaxID=2016596 RepID=A0A6C1B6X9_9RHOO|nr:GGDEF domain-containing protein [Nitrogeniibacter mangrovi]QID19512.1 GGDEF domain-containing protein [Nitrogeniibacter mangrovi]